MTQPSALAAQLSEKHYVATVTRAAGEGKEGNGGAPHLTLAFQPNFAAKGATAKIVQVTP